MARSLQPSDSRPILVGYVVQGVKTMPKPSIDLEWWPPDGSEPIGETRATELVAALRTIAGPVVEDAIADVRQRSHADTKIIRSGVYRYGLCGRWRRSTQLFAASQP